MNLIEILLIAVGLAMDAFAVSLAAGAARFCEGPRPVFRLAFHFGLFQAGMPVLGWFLGTTVAAHVQAVDHWIAFGLLAFVGGKMVYSGLKADEDSTCPDPSRGWTLVALSLATSIDAFAVGLSLAMIRVDIWLPSALIGLVTAGLAVAGTQLGRSLGARFGARVEVAGGLVLIGIGSKILLEHLLA